jgi:hypothetical protein
VKRIAAWVGGAAGAAFGYRLLRRRRGEASEDVSEPDDPAEELRAKLAETRADEPEEPSSVPAGEPGSLDERRRRVHEEGRSAIDEMKGE